MLAEKLSGASADKLYVDDVFSSFCYTGNGSTQTITNGIDLAGKGGMVWFKDRVTLTSHYIIDTVRGTTKYLVPDLTQPENTVGGYSYTANSNGFTLPGASQFNVNGHATVGWTFRKAPKFFDVVTYTGDGVAGRQIPHSLGIEPGMVIVKCTSAAGAWATQHRSVAMPAYAYLSLTGGGFAAQGANAFNGTAATASSFTVGSDTEVNASGGTYVAYLWAHDTATDGIVQCGTFTTDGSGNATVNLGWEPQFLITKASTAVQDWWVNDTARGMSLSYASEGTLRANTPGAEFFGFNAQPTATGFTYNNSASTTYLYLAIRRPNKPPTVGTQVYNAIARTGTGAAATVTGVGFAPDVVLDGPRSATSRSFISKLRGRSQVLLTNTTTAEQVSSAAADLTSFDMDGISVGSALQIGLNQSTTANVLYFFKRAPGVFDEVCFSAPSGNANQRVAHNLSVVPELMIVRSRNPVSAVTCHWMTYVGSINNYLQLDATAGLTTGANSWGTSPPTTTDFGINPAIAVYNYGENLVAYLFATKAGISKVFSYTGNGSSQTINCGFTTGARFILIKRTDAAGDWYVWDTVRGIIAGNDPHLSLNTTAVEVTTDDSIDPDTSGFIVNQLAATNINVNTAIYIGLAFA